MSRPRRSLGYRPHLPTAGGPDHRTGRSHRTGRPRGALWQVIALVVVTMVLAGVGFRTVTHAVTPKAAPAPAGWQVPSPGDPSLGGPTSNDMAPGEATSVAPEPAPSDPSPAERDRGRAPGAVVTSDRRPPATASSPRARESARLEIPELQVSAPVRPVGDAGGELLVPSDLHEVGRWTGGARLDDDSGTVLLAGHVRVGQREGVGLRWGELSPGAVIITVDDRGRTEQWRAVEMTVHRGTELPSDLFRTVGAHRLALVTCAGPVVEVMGRREYRDNLVIIAEPVGSAVPTGDQHVMAGEVPE